MGPKAEGSALDSSPNLSKRAYLHKRWYRRFRTSDNLQFFDDFLKNLLIPLVNPQKPSPLFLDAGCGSAEKTLALYEQGFSCVAVDFSDWALAEARETIAACNPSAAIQLLQGDLSDLEFDSGSFDHILCWGVLMHIEAIEKPLAEMSRVLKPGGLLVLSEINAASLESRAKRLVSRFPYVNAVTRDTELGVEVMRTLDDRKMFVRHSNIPALIERVEAHGFDLVTRATGQFTEFYKYSSLQLWRQFFHKVNRLLFLKNFRSDHSYGNLLIFRRR